VELIGADYHPFRHGVMAGDDRVRIAHVELLHGERHQRQVALIMPCGAGQPLQERGGHRRTGDRTVAEAPRVGDHVLRLGGDGPLGPMRRWLFRHFGHVPPIDVPNLAPVLHAQFARGGALALPLARALGLRMAVTLHGGDVSKRKNWHGTVLARRWPDWSETDLALTRALDDDNEHVRQAAVRTLTGKSPGSSATVSMLRQAARDPNWPNRASAVRLLQLWRSPEAQAGLIEAARDQVTHVHYAAVVGLVTGWPLDDRTWDALGWAACSSFDGLHHLAYERLSGGVSDAVPDRATLLAARRVPDLLLLATWWGEDPDAAAVLREHLQHHDILRAASLAAVLTRSGNDPATKPQLISAAQDECPAVRRIALEGLIRMPDSTWTRAARNDPDPYLRYKLLAFRSLTDKSPLFSTEISETLRRNADSVLFSRLLFTIAAVRASAGLLEPAALEEATLGASYVSPDNAEWLQWLVRVTADPPKS